MSHSYQFLFFFFFDDSSITNNTLLEQIYFYGKIKRLVETYAKLYMQNIPLYLKEVVFNRFSSERITKFVRLPNKLILFSLKLYRYNISQMKLFYFNYLLVIWVMPNLKQIKHFIFF